MEVAFGGSGSRLCCVSGLQRDSFGKRLFICPMRIIVGDFGVESKLSDELLFRDRSVCAIPISSVFPPVANSSYSDLFSAISRCKSA